MISKITYTLEFTDTFGGDANYSWVRRDTLKTKSTITRPALVRRAKSKMGITGAHRLEILGEMLAIYPRGECTVLFITPTH